MTLPLGQFYDVLHLFSLTGEPSEKHYLLMNGDLVDRGSWSIEVILLAFAYKCMWLSGHFSTLTNFVSGLYPKFMFINRGNHEAKDMNRTYGFEGEAKHKHGEQSYKASFLLHPHLLVNLPLNAQLFAHVFTTCQFELRSKIIPTFWLICFSAARYPCVRNETTAPEGKDKRHSFAGWSKKVLCCARWTFQQRWSYARWYSQNRQNWPPTWPRRHYVCVCLSSPLLLIPCFVNGILGEVRIFFKVASSSNFPPCKAALDWSTGYAWPWPK